MLLSKGAGCRALGSTMTPLEQHTTLFRHSSWYCGINRKVHKNYKQEKRKIAMARKNVEKIENAAQLLLENNSLK